MRTGDFRRSFAEGPPKCCLAGPVLEEASYPDVLVARAYSDGTGPELVLHPGRGNGDQQIGIARLQPGARYHVAGATVGDVTASAQGTAELTISLNGRTEVTLKAA